MLSTLLPIVSLLLGIGILLIGNGLLGTLLALRAGLEGISDPVIGLVMSAYFVGFFGGTFICPTLIRRVGHIRAFAIFAAIAAVAALLHVLMIEPMFWLALRVVSGVCQVGLYTVIESWLNASIPNARRGQVFGAYMVVTLFALALGQALITHADPAGFPLFAIASMLMSLALLPIAFTSIPQPQLARTPRLGLRFLYRASPAAVGGTLTSGLIIGAFWGMGPVFALRIGLDEAGVAGFMSATILGGAALQWPIGHLSDRVDRRRVLAVIGATAALVALVTLLLTEGPVFGLVLATFLFGGLAFSVYPVSVAHMNDHLQPEEALEGSSGLLLLHGLGAAAGPALVGVLIGSFGPRSLLIYFAVALASLAVFVALRIRQAPPVALEDHAHFAPMVRTSPEALAVVTDTTPSADPEAS
ncbi:MAG: MFS transporter [Pseudomonadota bacterium]|nr:MFS transporter [Pseudomonadota bacterium]